MSDRGITWLASYPRSGNTWVRLLLAHALRGDEARVDLNALPFGNIACSRDLVDDALGFESADLPAKNWRALWPAACRHIAETHADPLFIKSHARWPDELSQSEELAQATAGVVLIVRHPADVAVSLSHFFDLSLDRAIEIMANTAYSYNHPPGGIIESLPEWAGSWSTHLDSWLECGLRLHLVKYEDLLANPEATLQGILSFAQLSVPRATLRHAVQQTTLKNLQTAESSMGFREAPTHQRPFFRSGTVGSAQSALTSAQLDSLTQRHGKTMLHFGYH